MVEQTQIDLISKKLSKLLNFYTKKKDLKSQPKIPGLAIGLTNDKETVYFDYNGVLDVETNRPLSKDTRFCYFSCTKALTAFAVLKLHEEGKLKISDEAGKYVPEIYNLGIVDKGTVDQKTGEFLKPPRKPKTNLTIHHLLTQTAAISYPFLNEEYNLLSRLKNPHVNSATPTRELFKPDKTPLIGEPGVEFLYGHSMDWAGLIVEQVSGMTLENYLKKILFEPAGMTSCTFHVKDPSNLIRTHMRRKGGIQFYPKGAQLDPPLDMGGQGCFGSVGDYLKLIRIWLNYGYSPDAGKRLLSEDLVKYAIQNHLPPGVSIKFDIPGFPELKDGFTLSGMAITREEPATGRPVNTIYWSGLANLYYWIDYENKIGGFWGSQILPPGDQHSFLGYCKMEMAVYDTINGEEDDDEDDEDDDEDDEDDEDEEGEEDSTNTTGSSSKL